MSVDAGVEAWFAGWVGEGGVATRQTRPDDSDMASSASQPGPPTSSPRPPAAPSTAASSGAAQSPAASPAARARAGSPCLSPQQEADRIIARYGEDFPAIMSMLERQFGVLHNRAQVLLALAGVVITTTGFSGRLIAGTNRAAQVCIIIGVALALLSAAVVCWGVLHLRWLTLQPGDDLRSWLLTSLGYRDTKTSAYRLGVIILLVGLVFYVIAIAIALLYPAQGMLSAR